MRSLQRKLLLIVLCFLAVVIGCFFLLPEESRLDLRSIMLVTLFLLLLLIVQDRERLRLAEARERGARRELTVLYEVYRQTARQEDVGAILEDTLLVLQRHLKFSGIMIFLRSQDEKKFFLHSHSGFENELAGKIAEIPATDGSAEHVALHGEVYFGKLKDKLPEPLAQLLCANDYSELAVYPLKNGESTIGSIAIVTKKDIRLREKDRSLLAAVSIQLSQLLQKALLFVSLNQELKERKKVEAELKAAKELAEQANAAKSEFLANMSHEIRTPLNAIIGFGELLLALGGDARQRNYAEAIHVAGEKLLTLINDILDLSKVEAGRLELQENVVNLEKVFSELEQIFRQRVRSKNLELRFELSPLMPPALLLDETRLRQILLNLVGNAVKFTENGYVKVAAACRTLPPESGSRVELIISVEDTGIGIPQDEQERVFESFRQQAGQSNRKYSGTGLGLTITRKLVSIMGGKLELLSCVGSGSVFTVSLPNVAVPVVREEVEQPVIASRPRFAKALVMVVDDAESNRLLVKAILNSAGLDVVTAENGHAAILLAQEIRPDLILLDVRMPVLDGFAAGRRLKEDRLTAKIPVLAITASPQEAVARQSECGFAAVLGKPLTGEALLAALGDYLPLSEELPEEAELLREVAPQAVCEMACWLEEELLPLLRSCSGALKMGEVGQLASLLLYGGEKWQQPVLEKKGRCLMESAQTFDVEKIVELLRETTSLAQNWVRREK